MVRVEEICVFSRDSFRSQPFFVQEGYSELTFVDNMCKNLWVRLWRGCGKKFWNLWKTKFYTKMWENLRVLHVLVEKFYLGFCTYFYRGEYEFYTFSTAPTTITTNILERAN